MRGFNHTSAKPSGTKKKMEGKEAAKGGNL